MLLPSVDGLHQSDLARYVDSYPHCALAALVAGGTEYTAPKPPFLQIRSPAWWPSSPGGPGTTGVFYDDTFNHQLLAPGTITCTTTQPGTEVSWTEAADRSRNPIVLDAGQGLTDHALTALPTNTLAQAMAGRKAITAAIPEIAPTPHALLNSAALPAYPTTSLPRHPAQYLRVNTVFEAPRSHSLRTAWSGRVG